MKHAGRIFLLALALALALPAAAAAATIDDLRALGYDVRVQFEYGDGCKVWVISGWGMYNNGLGSDCDEGFQATLDRMADPAAHTERVFQIEQPVASAARFAIRSKGYEIERPDATINVFAIRGGEVDLVAPAAELAALAVALPCLVCEPGSDDPTIGIISINGVTLTIAPLSRATLDALAQALGYPAGTFASAADFTALSTREQLLIGGLDPVSGEALLGNQLR
jgi:hypothetical protein